MKFPRGWETACSVSFTHVARFQRRGQFSEARRPGESVGSPTKEASPVRLGHQSVFPVTDSLGSLRSSALVNPDAI